MNKQPCNCRYCTMKQIARGLPYGEDWAKQLEAIVFQAPFEYSSDQIEQYVLKCFDSELQRIIDKTLKSGVCNRIVDAKEWTEWHLEAWSRLGNPEPIPSWIGTVHP